MERTVGGREAEPAALVSALPCLPSSPALQSDSASRKLLEKEKTEGEREARQSAGAKGQRALRWGAGKVREPSLGQTDLESGTEREAVLR